MDKMISRRWLNDRGMFQNTGDELILSFIISWANTDELLGNDSEYYTLGQRIILMIEVNSQQQKGTSIMTRSPITIS